MINLDELEFDLTVQIERLEQEIAVATKDLARAKKIKYCNHDFNVEKSGLTMVQVYTCKNCGYSEEYL